MIVEQRLLAAVQIHAPHRHGHHVRAAGFERTRRLLKGFIFSRSYDQPRTKFASGDNEWIVHAYIVMKVGRCGAGVPARDCLDLKRLRGDSRPRLSRRAQRTWVDLKNIGADNISLVFIFSAPGFEENMRCSSVPAGQPAPPIHSDELRACAHKGHVVHEVLASPAKK